VTRSTVDRRIFIVGAPRSGTTLLQSLLAAHSEVTSFTESHFFRTHYSNIPVVALPILSGDPRPRVFEFLAENGETPPPAAQWFSERNRWTLRIRAFLPFQTIPVARRLIRVLDELALRRGVENWVEKTPWHLRAIPLLEKASPGERPYFLHVIRNGMEVVASLHRASRKWQRSYDLEACVARWNADLGRSLERTGSPNDRFVAYEELTSHPEATVKEILAGLGLAWEPAILKNYAGVSESVITAGEDWKAGVGRRIRPSATSDELLTPQQRQWVVERLNHRLYDRVLESCGRRSHAAAGAG